MNTDLVQSMIDIVFKGNLVYLTPFLFILMAILFSDRFIDLIVQSFIDKRKRY